MALIAAVVLAGNVGAAAESSAAPPLRSFEVRIERVHLGARAQTLRVTHGEWVRLDVSSDAPATVHLHGYDIEARVAPGAVATMKFQAGATGRFPLGVHLAEGGQRERVLIYLEVHPR